MLNLSSIMLGSQKPAELAAFWEKVLGKPADMHMDDWYGWSAGNTYFSIGSHSEVGDKATDPKRIIFNFESDDVQGDFDRIKDVEGIQVIKEPYDAGDGHMIATLADPDGNYFQLNSPWK